MYYQNPQPPRMQNYYEIHANCIQTGRLFEDPEFPPVATSLFVKTNFTHRVDSIVWKRPFEIVNRPKFFSDGVSRFDVVQGELGNCWFIAAVTNLTFHPNLLEHVVPRDNTLEPGQYSGAVHFRFWSFGVWTEVVVDDRLPCDRRGELLFMQSEDKSEFWSCLLEKAYAKFHGSYESLVGGTAAEALQDFSGGIVETIDIKENDKELFYVMKKAYQRQSLMTCALHTRAGPGGIRREEKTSAGLVRGHAYSITAVHEIPVYNGVELVPLVRIRNPWGTFEWNGPWSDSSQEWRMVDANTKAMIGLTARNDGEFWMSVFDFENQFSRLDICHLSPDPVSDGDIRLPAGQIPWKRDIFEGRWIPGQNAGGCMNNNTFARNPQYFVNFEASDVDGDANKCTVVVSLLQRTLSRSYTRREGVGKYCIGFRLFKVNRPMNPGESLDLDYFKQRSHKSLGSGAYTDSREVSARFELNPGMYCIVPSTFEPNVEGQFLLRIFSEPPSPNRMAHAPYNQPYANNYNQYQHHQPVQFGQPAPLPSAPPPPSSQFAVPMATGYGNPGLPPAMPAAFPVPSPGLPPPGQFAMPPAMGQPAMPPPGQFPVPGSGLPPPGPFPMPGGQFPGQNQNYQYRVPSVNAQCYSAPNANLNSPFPQAPPQQPPGGGNIGWNL